MVSFEQGQDLVVQNSGIRRASSRRRPSEVVLALERVKAGGEVKKPAPLVRSSGSSDHEIAMFRDAAGARPNEAQHTGAGGATANAQTRLAPSTPNNAGAMLELGPLYPPTPPCSKEPRCLPPLAAIVPPRPAPTSPSSVSRSEESSAQAASTAPSTANALKRRRDLLDNGKKKQREQQSFQGDKQEDRQQDRQQDGQQGGQQDRQQDGQQDKRQDEHQGKQQGNNRDDYMDDQPDNHRDYQGNYQVGHNNHHDNHQDKQQKKQRGTQRDMHQDRREVKEQDEQAKQVNPIVVPHDDSMAEQPFFLDDQAMQKVFYRLVQGMWINDDCIHILLEAFNPNPSLWYIASTHLVQKRKPAGTTTLSRFKNVASLPRKLMFPLHLSNMAHWTLVVFDREEKRCIVYDPNGSKSCSKMAWETVQGFLTQQNLLSGKTKVDLDPFPDIRQSDDTNCGIFVLAIAIHLLQGEKVKRVTPGFWRELFAGFFSINGEAPRSWMGKYLPSHEESTHSLVERYLADLENNLAASSEVKARGEEARCLLNMAERQVQMLQDREEHRREKAAMHDWLSSMPITTDEFMSDVVSRRRSDGIVQLNALPNELRGGSHQMQVLRDGCVGMLNDGDRVMSNLNQRGENLLGKIMSAHEDISARLEALRS